MKDKRETGLSFNRRACRCEPLMPAMEEVVSVKATGVRMHKRLGAHKASCHGRLAQWERMYAREGVYVQAHRRRPRRMAVLEHGAVSFCLGPHAECGHCSSVVDFRDVSDVIQLW